MLYCYLADTALTPLTTDNIINYDSFTGVGQLNERVLSVFNVDYTASIDSSLIQKYPNIIADPRYSDITDINNRQLGLFTGSPVYVTGTNVLKAEGKMQLHYDAWMAAFDGATDEGNLIAKLSDKKYATEFKALFNVIELCMYSHTFDATTGTWVYSNSNTLNGILLSNPSLYGGVSYGYIQDSLAMSQVDYANDKTAKVRNIDTTASTRMIKDAMGTNVSSQFAPILFPNWIQFDFKFSGLNKYTSFKIYLNPKFFLNNYSRTKITNIVCPTKPSDLIGLAYTDIYTTLSASSTYVANTITGEVTKTEVMDTTNHTGAMDINLRYHLSPTTSELKSTYDMHFTCIYKGRRPSTQEAYAEIRNLLLSQPPPYEGASVEDIVKKIFPELFSWINYIVVPNYDLRIDSSPDVTGRYSINIVSMADTLCKFNGKPFATEAKDVPVFDKCCIIDMPAYSLHAVTYPEQYATEAAVGLDKCEEFKTYQPIKTSDPYWDTMSAESQLLNKYLSKILANQLYNIEITDMPYTVSSLTLFGDVTARPKTYIVVTVGAYVFSVMTKESYNNAES